MKSNEIYDKLKGRIDHEVVKVLVAIAEDQAATKKMIIGVAHGLDQLTDIVALHSQILNSFKEPIDQLRATLARAKKANEMVMSEDVMGVDEEIEQS